MKQYYAVVDTNVLVSALLATLKDKESSPLKILHHILDGTIIPIFNDEIIDEYREVLHRPKFQFPENAIEQVLNAISILGVHSDRIKSEDTCNDPKDVVFYEVTLSVDEAYLITGNIKHFPIKPFVVTPAQMIEILLSGDNRDKLNLVSD